MFKKYLERSAKNIKFEENLKFMTIRITKRLVIFSEIHTSAPVLVSTIVISNTTLCDFVEDFFKPKN